MVAHSALGRTLETTTEAAKKTGQKIVRNAFEQTTGIHPKKKGEAKARSFTPEEAGLLYGNYGQELPSDEQLGQMTEQSRIDSALLYQQRQEQFGLIQSGRTDTALSHDQMLKQKNSGKKPVVNVFNEGKPTTEVSEQMVQTAVQDLRENAQRSGVQSPNAEEQERQHRKKIEAEVKARKKEEEKLRMEAPVEAPPGKISGLSFNRKRPAQKLQKPPNSAERRAGAGKDT